jgi:hypothetical protein
VETAFGWHDRGCRKSLPRARLVRDSDTSPREATDYRMATLSATFAEHAVEAGEVQAMLPVSGVFFRADPYISGSATGARVVHLKLGITPYLKRASAKERKSWD